MSCFTVYFKEGGYTKVSALDMFHAMSELNQRGHRYDVAFIIEDGQEQKLINHVRGLASYGKIQADMEDSFGPEKIAV